MLNDKSTDQLTKRKLYNLPPYVYEIASKFEARIHGKKGAGDLRERFYGYVKAHYLKHEETRTLSSAEKKRVWVHKYVCTMCSNVDTLRVDEHGFGEWNGSLSVYVRDFIAPWQGSAKSPYFDMGGEGLALITLSRTREYSKAYTRRYGYGHASTRYLVGKNEAGTYFCHSVSKECNNVLGAIDWIWNGHSDKIVQRQGDIALIKGVGPKYPAGIPRGHVVGDDKITHATHPDLPLPGKGQRIIVGRRAAEYVGRNARD